jgi:hypothetical protein
LEKSECFYTALEESGFSSYSYYYDTQDKKVIGIGFETIYEAYEEIDIPNADCIKELSNVFEKAFGKKPKLILTAWVT